MEPGEAFGPRLRQERERRQISLASIAADTKISVSLLEGLERDDVRRWPSGIFRRSFIRSYARAIGMDADAVLHEFQERFPDPRDAPQELSPEPAPEPVPRPAISTSTSSSSQIDIVLRVRVPRSWVGWIRWMVGKRPGSLTVTEPEA